VLQDVRDVLSLVCCVTIYNVYIYEYSYYTISFYIYEYSFHIYFIPVNKLNQEYPKCVLNAVSP